MLIFVVTSGNLEFDDYRIHGLFTDKAKADRASELVSGRVEEHFTDSFKDPHPGLLPFYVYPDPTDPTGSALIAMQTSIDYVREEFEPWASGLHVWAANETDAVQKILKHIQENQEGMSHDF